MTDGDRSRVRLGIHPTPAAGDPTHVADLAAVAEQSGLDVVVVQDHPYQPTFLDGFVTAAAVCAATDRIEVWTHVAALPLRLPVPLAKAVASLDLLWGGRAGLVLSAGDFTEGIVAAGGTVPSGSVPSGSGPSLAAAIRVVRGCWAGSGIVSVPDAGVDRLLSGPRPPHRPPLWVTARTPDDPALADADGVLLSMATLAPADVAGFVAGLAPRDWPLEVGYVWAGGDLDELGDLAAIGVSLLLVATDDPDDVLDLADAAADIRARAASGEARAPRRAPLRVSAAPTDVGDRPHVPAPVDALYTPAQQVAPADLVARHDALRAELARIHDLVDQTARGGLDPSEARTVVQQMALRTTAWNLGGHCAAYCRVVSTHHTDEDDTLFPGLRAAEPALAPVLDQLEAEHELVAGALTGFDDALVAVVAGTGTLDQVRTALVTLSDRLLTHLAYEETELLHPLARHSPLPRIPLVE